MASEQPEVPAALRIHLAEIHQRLTLDRQRTSERIAALRRDIGSIIDGARLTATDDEHDPEGSTIAFERSQSSALLTWAGEHLDEVDAALKKIASGGYGYCEGCGELIDPRRLLARPTARTCMTCAS